MPTQRAGDRRGAQAFLAKQPQGDNSRVTIIRRDDGSVGVTVRTRVGEPETWDHQATSIK